MAETRKTERILIVDDTLANIQVLGTVLREEGYQITVAQNGLQALQAVTKVLPDLILLDVMMPELDGFETCTRLKSEASTRDIPVIFLTAKVQTEDIVRGFELGAVDYVTKPFNPTELLARVRTHLTIRRLQRELQVYSEELERLVAERTEQLRQAHRRLQLQVRELDGRDRLSHLQMGRTAPEKAYEAVLEVVREVLRVGKAGLYLPTADGALLQIAAALGLAGEGVLQGPDDLTDHPAVDTEGQELVALTFTDGRPRGGESGEIVVPILYQEERLGCLWVAAIGSDEADPEDLRDVLWRLGRETALLLHAVAINTELEAGQVDVSALLDLTE